MAARSGVTVLIAEDEELMRSFASRVLAEAGYAVVVAGDGVEALELLRERLDVVDLVLTDLDMPGMTGRELLQRVRELAPGLPVLLMSGYTSDGVDAEIAAAAPAAFIAKPFASGALTARVAELLASAGA
ncbi:Response regulator receiver domain [Gaiella occulta]|uniref:Response regulator receiver domain n=1 Tax=Gaiella occulta TaxID=1002870 RepID=A0A7M2YYE4_9ACTN|nr:Response regulator receiver domain [Gaiella occulta]